jgi:hypothetical protein
MIATIKGLNSIIKLILLDFWVPNFGGLFFKIFEFEFEKR